VGDRASVGPARVFLVVASALGVCSLGAGAASRGAPEIAGLIERVGERVADYHRRAQSLVCIETHTVQPLALNWSVDGMARTVQSELRVEADAADAPGVSATKLRREVHKINGRLPRERDRKARAGCTDPDALSPEPLSFLLPDGREEYSFTAVRDGRERGRPALVVDFSSANRKTRLELVEDGRGHDDCFDWSGPIATKGRIWIDAVTYDVLRVDRHNEGPVDLRVPWKLQRRYAMAPYFVLERDDLTLRYRAVEFKEPDEVIVLPESVDALTIVRSGLQSVRRTTTFTGYRRFLTGGRVK
jgi:hypothetical protein